MQVKGNQCLLATLTCLWKNNSIICTEIRTGNVEQEQGEAERGKHINKHEMTTKTYYEEKKGGGVNDRPVMEMEKKNITEEKEEG